MFLAMPLALIAHERTTILDLFASMAAALSAGDVAAFLEPIDRGFAELDTLRGYVTGLLDAADVTNSVEVLTIEGNHVELDWQMRLRSRIPGSASEERRQTLKVELNAKGRILSLQPVAFFRPLTTR